MISIKLAYLGAVISLVPTVSNKVVYSSLLTWLFEFKKAVAVHDSYINEARYDTKGTACTM